MTSSKTFVTLKEKYDRVVVLIDMDCFYCQVEEFDDEERLNNKPIAVVQYLQNAGIIAVNYAARALGVTRHMREKEALATCPQLICVKVPSKNGKADLSKYRDAGYRVAKVLQTFTPLLERASVDEAYLDITENVSKKMQEMRDNTFHLEPSNFVNTFAVGYENFGSFVQDVTSSVDKNFDDVPEEDRKAVASSKLRLLIGASIVNEIRKAVKNQTKYECSAGIAHNKILAKLTCGMNKPNKQTILPIESIQELFRDLDVSKVKSLGGKLGEEVCSKLKARKMGDILKFSESELQTLFQPRVGSWLYWIARGIDLETVTPKFMSKSIAVSKNFRGKNEITSSLTLKFWLTELAKEVVERLEKDAMDNNRTAKQLIVSFMYGPPKSAGADVSTTRTVPLLGNSLNSYTAEKIAEVAVDTIKRNMPKFLKEDGTVLLASSIKHLGISAGKFEDNVAGTSKNLQSLLKNHQKREVKKSPTAVKKKEETIVKTAPEAIASIKKFEMKSPKSFFQKKISPPEVKSPEIAAASHAPVDKIDAKTDDKSRLETSAATHDDQDKKQIDETPEAVITSSASFAGEHAIRGIKTLKHWLTELSQELCNKVKGDSLKHNRAPSEIYVGYKQLVEGRKKESVEVFSLADFPRGAIDVDVIMETLMRSENFLNSNKIQHPIIYLEVMANEFLSGEEWRYTIKDENAPVSLTKSPPIVEPEEEEMKKQESDEEFEQLVRDELDELNETEEHANDKEIPVTPLPSPDYGDPEDDIDTEETPTMDVDEELNREEDKPSAETPGPSYMQTYAEYQPQMLQTELLNPKEECAECGKMIWKLDMVAHLDHHLAFEIANEQREEYRRNKKPLTASSSQSTAKKKKNLPKKPAINLIEKYAVKTKPNENSEESVENKIQCEQCQKSIAADEYVSHLDYHFAQKLRDEEKRQNVPQKVDSTKRKRPGSTQKNLPKMKSMKSYFESTQQ